MEVKIKTFDELSTRELYEILKVRSEIFVVEQNCIYQDMGEIDYRSVHIFFEENGIVEAYLRIFEKDASKKIVQIGRVLTRIHGRGLGGKLLKEGVSFACNTMHAEEIHLEAQCYATGYYAKEGFQICSEEFLEDGIPHVKMKLICANRPL